MKTIPLFIFSLYFLNAFGQINLENTYNDGLITRVKLENSGEKYYLLDRATNQIKLYNANHTLWKTITLITNQSPLDLTIFHLSETKINADSNIEIAFSYYTDNGEIVYNSRIINELGTILLDVSNASSIEVSEIDGLPIKVLALIDDVNYSTKIYNVPSLTLENTYTGDDYVKRVKLESFGEKYYQLDKMNYIVNLYNANHSVWKNINLLPMENIVDLTINHLSETSINVDNKIEVAYIYYDALLNFEGKISNEDGVAILTIPNVWSINVDEISGLSNKLIAEFLDLSTFAYSSKVYGLSLFTVEGIYNEGIVTRAKLENSGEKYYLTDKTNKQAKLYNENHSSWKTINLPTNSGASLLSITHLSESVINEDASLEIAYVTFDSNTNKYESRIINDIGSSLLTVDNGLGIYASQIMGFSNKLVVPIDGVSESSLVYGLPTTLSLQEESLNKVEFLIYPNPTNHFLTLKSNNTSIKHFVITSVLGKIVKEVKQTTQSITVDVSDLNPGTYFIKGQTIDGVIFNHKFIVY